MKILEILFTFILVFFNSTLLVYDDISENDLLATRICAVIFYFIDFMLSMTSTKKVEGRTIENLVEVWQSIGTEKIVMDIINIIVLLVDISSSFYAMTFIRLVIIVKLPLVLKSMEEIEIKLITNS